jgi:hypothetical protein
MCRWNLGGENAGTAPPHSRCLRSGIVRQAGKIERNEKGVTISQIDANERGAESPPTAGGDEPRPTLGWTDSDSRLRPGRGVDPSVCQPHGFGRKGAIFPGSALDAPSGLSFDRFPGEASQRLSRPRLPLFRRRFSRFPMRHGALLTVRNPRFSNRFVKAHITIGASHRSHPQIFPRRVFRTVRAIAPERVQGARTSPVWFRTGHGVSFRDYSESFSSLPWAELRARLPFKGEGSLEPPRNARRAKTCGRNRIGERRFTLRVLQALDSRSTDRGGNPVAIKSNQGRTP